MGSRTDRSTQPPHSAVRLPGRCHELDTKSAALSSAEHLHRRHAAQVANYAVSVPDAFEECAAPRHTAR
jgi:hypothetical protein